MSWIQNLPLAARDRLHLLMCMDATLFQIFETSEEFLLGLIFTIMYLMPKKEDFHNLSGHIPLGTQSHIKTSAIFTPTGSWSQTRRLTLFQWHPAFSQCQFDYKWLHWRKSGSPQTARGGHLGSSTGPIRLKFWTKPPWGNTFWVIQAIFDIYWVSLNKP